MLDGIDQIFDSTGTNAAVCGLKAIYCPGKYAYLQIPAAELRNFFDGIFPKLAENALADTVSGKWHRWKAGHDLLIDVPKTLVSKDPGDAMKQAGHILLTDFPSKDGIPIPGLSQSGLGNFLRETCHISPQYLCVNPMDVMENGLGIFACGEGFLDLVNAFSNDLRMTPKLFLDTFIEGAADIAVGAMTDNPLFYIAGAEQIAAGMKIAFYTVTHPLWYVNPLDFFGGVLTGGVISFFVSKFILKNDTEHVVTDVAKSCAIGGAYAVSTCFGIAVILGLAACGVGKLMAERANREMISCFKISEEELTRLWGNSSDILLPEDNRIFRDADTLIEFSFAPSESIFPQNVYNNILCAKDEHRELPLPD